MTVQALRQIVIALISFLTLVDLFATQAILPSLAHAYQVSPAMIGAAVNACTLGMAAAGIAVAWFNQSINRRIGVSVCLALLSIPTLLLALMPSLTMFALLRIAQGVFMSAAFSLTVAYLAETSSTAEAASAVAAYVTGNVASNLVGRLTSATVALHFGLPSNFIFFAALNLAGAALAFVALRRMAEMTESSPVPSTQSWRTLLRHSELLACFAIGFLILFTFIGTFTYVNFVLSGPIGLSPMQIGLVYLVFLPSIIITPFAGRTAQRYGAKATVIGALAAAAVGLPMLAAASLPYLLFGLALVAAGTFFAQATATGFVGRSSGALRGAAGGIYLASYYAGGLVGSVLLGQIFVRSGWNAVLVAIAAAFAVAGVLASQLTESEAFLHATPISNS